MFTKTIGLLFFISSAAFAATDSGIAAIDLKVSPDSEVKSVSCEKISNLNHDEALAGTAVIVTGEHKEVKMSLVISRFGNVELEAETLCLQLRDASKSGKKFDIIFQENTDLEGKLRYDIKGAVKLNGLNPFFNG
ncbi:MAG: hypothetical protein ACXWQO_06865 [Bdellovibrionota bacterium]